MEDLPELDSIEAAKVWLARIAALCVAGLLSGSQGNAASKSVSYWLAANAAEVDLNRMRDLEQTIETLEKQLAGSRR